jgi:hypothetical protein
MKKGRHLVRLIRQLVFIALFAVALASCWGNDGGGSLSRGDLYPNGTSVNGSVAEGGECFYVLRNIKAGPDPVVNPYTYTLRTQIAPGGTVRMDVYTSEAAYKNGQKAITPLETLAYSAFPNDTMHEVVFSPATSGDYVVVLSGTAGTDGFGTLYFYDLRLMTSAADYLRTLTTSTLDPASYTSGTVLISPGYMHVFSSPVVTAGTYTISLYSMINTSPAATISYPQMFVYSDGSLAIRSLLYSVTSNSTEFNIFSTATGTSFSSSSAVVSSVTFTSGGPYIMLRGIGQVDYTLTVAP